MLASTDIGRAMSKARSGPLWRAASIGEQLSPPSQVTVVFDDDVLTFAMPIGATVAGIVMPLGQLNRRRAARMVKAEVVDRRNPAGDQFARARGKRYQSQLIRATGLRGESASCG